MVQSPATSTVPTPARSQRDRGAGGEVGVRAAQRGGAEALAQRLRHVGSDLVARRGRRRARRRPRARRRRARSTVCLDHAARSPRQPAWQTPTPVPSARASTSGTQSAPNATTPPAGQPRDEPVAVRRDHRGVVERPRRHRPPPRARRRSGTGGTTTCARARRRRGAHAPAVLGHAAQVVAGAQAEVEALVRAVGDAAAPAGEHRRHACDAAPAKERHPFDLVPVQAQTAGQPRGSMRISRTLRGPCGRLSDGLRDRRAGRYPVQDPAGRSGRDRRKPRAARAVGDRKSGRDARTGCGARARFASRLYPTRVWSICTTASEAPLRMAWNWRLKISTRASTTATP